MCSGLLDEVTRLVKTHKVALCILYRLTDGPVVRLPGVGVFGRTSKTLDCFLLKVWNCYDISWLIAIVLRYGLRVAMYRRNSSTALRLGSVSLVWSASKIVESFSI